MPHPNHGCLLVTPAGRRIAEAFQYAQVACTAVHGGALCAAAGTACSCSLGSLISWGSLPGDTSAPQMRETLHRGHPQTQRDLCRAAGHAVS